jgi:hypothetical protein
MNIQSVSNKEPLKTDSRNVLPDFHKKPAVQAMGTEIKLQSSPSDYKYGADTPNGKYQTLGTEIKLDKTPRKGWSQVDTPMSDRAVQASKGY